MRGGNGGAPPAPPPASEGAGATRHPPFHNRHLALTTASIGVFLVVMGFSSSLLVMPDFYRDFLSGYDPPFDAIAGVLLILLAVRIEEQSAVAWIFSLLAPTLTIFIAAFSPNLFSLASAAAATCLVVLIFPFRGGFYRGAVTGPASTQLIVVVAALMSLLFGMAGARELGSDFAPQIHGWSEALYFTVTTISTNGSEYAPLTDTARSFVVILILLGVGTFLSAVVVLFLPFLERRLERIAQRIQRSQMEEISDHVIICGASTTARATAETFREEGVKSVILASDVADVEQFRTEGYVSQRGDSSSEEDLKSVGIGRARALIAADDSDAENLLTVITARGIDSQLRIVAVATAPSSLSKLRKAGANEAINAVAVAAKLVSSAALEAPGATGVHSHTIVHG
ncbi:MAG: NAD-binding protein [Thermoplasmata archaeon]